MAEWQPLWVFPRDRGATGLMYWPASGDDPEEIRFGLIWNYWAIWDRPTYWIPCAAPGSPQSPWLRLQQWIERRLYRIWPRDDMTESFVSYYSWRIGYALSWPWRALKQALWPPAADLDDELPF